MAVWEKNLKNRRSKLKIFRRPVNLDFDGNIFQIQIAEGTWLIQPRNYDHLVAILDELLYAIRTFDHLLQIFFYFITIYPDKIHIYL